MKLREFDDTGWFATHETVPRSIHAGGTFTLLPHQETAVREAETFVEDVLRDPRRPGGFGRMVLPPRTGKTVIATEVVARTGLAAVFVVPTRALVRQVHRVATAALPNVAVGIYSGEEDRLVEGGVHVTTYAALERRTHSPAAFLTRSPLVFLDEAHHVMSPGRVALLRSAFAHSAVRIGLTATPDYDETRTLCRTFPDLVHELPLEDALTADLLAPLRFWVIEVDAQRNAIPVRLGDFAELELGRALSTYPTCEAVRALRYSELNRNVQALISCVTRQQASDVHAYLRAHRPTGAPEPALILGETDMGAREAALQAFDESAIDTLVQVGVLIEGWTSERCKLLIDVAPTLSRVRATQKYFRVLTRWGTTEARIYIVVPSTLPTLPVLPHELFGRGMMDYECGTVIEAHSRAGTTRGVEAATVLPVGARVLSRVLRAGRLQPPRLRPNVIADVRRVLLSCADLDSDDPPSHFTFRDLHFEHPLFEGRGQALLRWLGVAPTRQAYIAWLVRAMPEGAGNAWLKSVGERSFITATTAHDVRIVLKRLSKSCGSASPEDGLLLARTCRGVGFEPPLTPEQVAAARSERASLERGLGCLDLRRKRAIAERFGLLGMRSRTIAEMAEDRSVSHGRAWMLVQEGLRTLRGSQSSEDDRAVILPRLGRASQRPAPVVQVAASHGQPGVDGWVLLDTPWSFEDVQRAVEKLLVGLGLRPLHWESLAGPVEWRDADGKGVALSELPACRGGAAFRAWSYQSFELGCEGEAEPRHECGVALDGLPGGVSLELRGRGSRLEEQRALWDDRGTTVRQARCSHVIREWASVLGATTRRPKRLRRRK